MSLRNHIERAIAACGSQSALATKAGLSQSGISWMLREAAQISAETAIAIEKATDGTVSRHDLRPDIFGPAPSTEAA